MKFSSNHDISAPASRVFAAVSDFDYYERRLLRRGMRIERLADGDKGPIGMAWRAEVTFRGRPKTLVSRVTAFDDGDSYEITTDAGGVTAYTTFELTELGPARTRLTTGLDLRPDSLSGRLLIQSLKFAKGNLTGRYKKRMATLAEDVATRANLDQ